MEPTAPSDLPLGELLVRASLVSREEAEEALAAALASGRRLGDVLLERGWVPEREIARLVAQQEDLDFVDLGKFDVDLRAAALLPEALARRATAVAYAFEDDVVVVAVADPADGAVLDALLDAVPAHVRFVVATRTEVEAALEDAYGGLPPAA